MDDGASDRAHSPTRFLRDDDDDAGETAASGAQTTAHDDVDYLLHPDLSLSALSTLVSPPRARANKRRDRDLEASPRESHRRGILAHTPQSSPRGAEAAAAAAPKRVRFQPDEAQPASAQTTGDARDSHSTANSEPAQSPTGDPVAPAASSAAAVPLPPSAPSSDATDSSCLLHPRPSFLFFRAAHYAKLKAAFPELCGFQCSKPGEPLVSLLGRPEALTQPVTVYLPAPTPTAQPAAATGAASVRSSRVWNPVLAQAVPMGVVVAAAAAAPVVAVATPAPAAAPRQYPCPTVGQGNDEISRLLGAEWRAMTPEQKRPYDQMALLDRERYFKAKAQQAHNAVATGNKQGVGETAAHALSNPDVR